MKNNIENIFHAKKNWHYLMDSHCKCTKQNEVYCELHEKLLIWNNLPINYNPKDYLWATTENMRLIGGKILQKSLTNNIIVRNIASGLHVTGPPMDFLVECVSRNRDFFTIVFEDEITETKDEYGNKENHMAVLILDEKQQVWLVDPLGCSKLGVHDSCAIEKAIMVQLLPKEYKIIPQKKWSCFEPYINNFLDETSGNVRGWCATVCLVIIGLASISMPIYHVLPYLVKKSKASLLIIYEATIRKYVAFTFSPENCKLLLYNNLKQKTLS